MSFGDGCFGALAFGAIGDISSQQFGAMRTGRLATPYSGIVTAPDEGLVGLPRGLSTADGHSGKIARPVTGRMD